MRRANEELLALRQEGCVDGETLGLLARTHKDLALAAPHGPIRDKHLAAAFEIYSAGYRESVRRGKSADGYYTGINAATMALLLGNKEPARKIAKDVQDICRQVIREDRGRPGETYWPQATLAEAALILGEREQAQEYYGLAASLAGTHYGDISSTRHQARLLLEHPEAIMSLLGRLFRSPAMAAYNQAMELFNAKRYDEAVVAFKDALKQLTSPTHPYRRLAHFYLSEALSHSGQARQRQGDFSGAEKDLLSAIDAEPEFPDLHFRLGCVRVQKGRFG